jgi:hypothetical protein
LKIPLVELFRNDMKSLHAKFGEFSMHRNEDIILSLFSVPEFCTLDDQKLRIFDYMKDVVLREAVPTKFNSYFSDLWFIFYEF